MQTAKSWASGAEGGPATSEGHTPPCSPACLYPWRPDSTRRRQLWTLLPLWTSSSIKQKLRIIVFGCPGIKMNVFVCILQQFLRLKNLFFLSLVILN